MDIASIRKVAAVERGRRLFEQPPAEMPALFELRLEKAAQADDRQLLRIAARLAGDTLETYEALGGTFGHPGAQRSRP